MIIREATTDDVETIFDIRTSVRENHLSRDRLAELGLTPQAVGQTIAASPCLWVAEMDGTPAGFVMIDMDDACLFALFVKAEFEGSGCGRLLLEKGEAALFASHSTIWLTTAGDSRAAGFYRRLGWMVTEELPDGDLRFTKTHAGAGGPAQPAPT